MMERLSYDHASKFAQAGAKILFDRSIRLAKQKGIAIQCAALMTDGKVRYGTRVGSDGRGVQVSFPKRARILYSLPKDTIAAGRTATIPIQGKSHQYIVCTDATVNKNLDDATDPISELLMPVITVDPSGQTHGYLFDKAEALKRAYDLHEVLIEKMSGEGNLRTMRKLPKKERGAYTAVYSGPQKSSAS